MNEIWKQYKGTQYSVSNFGFIRNDTTARVLAGNVTRQGYVKFGLWHNGKCSTVAVHRLIAETFLENPSEHPVVNHKDGNPANNRLDNLEWVSFAENIQHAYDTGLAARGEASVNSVLSEETVLEIREMLVMGFKTTEIAAHFGTNTGTISHIRLGKTWKHLGPLNLPNGSQKGKLKADDIPDIRARLASGEGLQSIAERYGVHRGSIDGIARGRNWKNY